ncbi:MAG: hypothetical protein ACR2IP_13330 [Solirubrobacteraceae bacterium]
MAPPGVDPNGASADPSIAENGLLVAFASQASNLGPVVGNRRVGNIYLFNVLAGSVSLVSAGRGGRPANGVSSSPSISTDGKVVAFASQATNLVAGVHTQFSEVYVRVGNGPIRLLSPTFQQPDGDSTQPVVSADGRFVAFTSSSDNVIAGDDNANSDVFRVDLATGTLRRVSVSGDSRQARGASYNPSISADGRLVSFTSSAPNLVAGDRNRVPDVFVHNMDTGGNRRASVSSGGRQQNASVAAPFTQVSDLSADGHYVVFDSGARNLARGGTSGHTQVFRHSLISGRTSLISTSSLDRHGDNDSFAPSTSADGRVSAFESFADNLASPSAPSENIFAQDLASKSTLTLDVALNGGPRGPELSSQLLQRPAVSANGMVVAFASGANNLVANDYNGADDLFLRAIFPPSGIVVQGPPSPTTDRRPTVQVRGSFPLATYGLCELDGRRQACPIGRPFRLRRVGPGPHVLKVMVGAPGTLYDPKGVVLRFTEG